ncbi:MAG TPA: SDR family oxidoreductase [Pyrinomonadaceae bacterium]|jgi:NAD(P)-dependent dehydrogenase (short-subunit alcohol dehydrogenase family)|nr:SDR family oxidoreductase [Pyrinomonadaceae bacterium]
MDKLLDRVAVVTGSTSGIGEGIARMFFAEGASVVVSGRDEDKGERVAADIANGSGRAVFQRADVSREEDCRGLIDAAVKHFGQIDVLVNSAGLSTRSDIEDTTVALWDELFAINTRGPFLCMQQAVKYMKERRRGSIVNIGSVNAYIGEPKLMAYSATKGALMNLTKNTANYLNRYRIRVNQLNVGWTLTPYEHQIKLKEGKGENWAEEASRTRPFGRLLLPEDIAHAALYFASDDSECVTGSILDLEQYPVGAPPNF